jgi:cyclic pyranopterin phosphate synthase
MSEKDQIRMIDISNKDNIPRKAIAYGKIILKKETIQTIKDGRIKKGDPLSVAKIACIQAVKKTPELIPLCHNLPIDSVDVKFSINELNITVTCIVTANYKTGVEMEALTGVSVALLNIWDMVKYLEKDEKGQYLHTTLNGIKIIEKRKGK